MSVLVIAEGNSQEVDRGTLSSNNSCAENRMIK
jgi:hypothetical protein